MLSYQVMLACLPTTGAIIILIWMAVRVGLLSESEQAGFLPLLHRAPGQEAAEQGGAGRARRGRPVPWALVALGIVVLSGLAVPLATVVRALHSPASAAEPPTPHAPEDRSWGTE